jgi:hypothetical protein
MSQRHCPYTYRNHFKYYWTVDTLHTGNNRPFFYTIPYLEHEKSICRTRSQAPIQPKTANNSPKRPIVFYLTELHGTMHAHGSLQRYWSSSRSCHDVISGLFLVSDWRSYFVFWKKVLESYTANRRVTDIKYFLNYTNTYPIVSRLLLLSLLRPHKHRVQSGQGAKNFFYAHMATS